MSDKVYRCVGLDRPGCVITEWAEDGWCHWCGRRLTPKTNPTQGQLETIRSAVRASERATAYTWIESGGTSGVE